MSFRVLIKNFSLAILFLAWSCIEPYEPFVDPSSLNLLVVDGFVNATTGSAIVRLTRGQPLADLGQGNPESNATVTIDASTGTSYSLDEQDFGVYENNSLTIDKNALYTLRIKTFSDSEYISDTIRIKPTPAIDSLGFSISSNGESLNVLVNTHDQERDSRYYAWDFIETYEYNAPDSSEYKFVNKVAIPRTLDESVFTCWRTEDPTSISIGTSAKLKEDIISRFALTQIPKGSPKLSVRYSVLVKQRVVSAVEFNFLDQLRKTTETLDGIFGTTPFQVLGNMHRVGNDKEPVLGYFSGAEIKEKRLFIDFSDLPQYFRTLRTNVGCVFEQTCNIFPEPLTNGPQSCVPLENVSSTNIILRMFQANSYIFTSPECGDCTAKGGTTKRPDFW